MMAVRGIVVDTGDGDGDGDGAVAVSHAVAAGDCSCGCCDSEDVHDDAIVSELLPTVPSVVFQSRQ
jgi:hypothetical protein